MQASCVNQKHRHEKNKIPRTATWLRSHGHEAKTEPARTKHVKFPLNFADIREWKAWNTKKREQEFFFPLTEFKCLTCIQIWLITIIRLRVRVSSTNGTLVSKWNSGEEIRLEFRNTLFGFSFFIVHWTRLHTNHTGNQYEISLHISPEQIISSHVGSTTSYNDMQVFFFRT